MGESYWPVSTHVRQNPRRNHKLPALSSRFIAMFRILFPFHHKRVTPSGAKDSTGVDLTCSAMRDVLEEGTVFLGITVTASGDQRAHLVCRG